MGDGCYPAITIHPTIFQPQFPLWSPANFLIYLHLTLSLVPSHPLYKVFLLFSLSLPRNFLILGLSCMNDQVTLHCFLFFDSPSLPLYVLPNKVLVALLTLLPTSFSAKPQLYHRPRFRHTQSMSLVCTLQVFWKAQPGSSTMGLHLKDILFQFLCLLLLPPQI